MNRCINCGVWIRDNSQICPLCAAAPEVGDRTRTKVNSEPVPKIMGADTYNGYPDIIRKNRKLLMAVRIYLFCALVASSILIYINAVLPFKTFWAGIPVVIMIYAYAVARCIIVGKSGYMSKVIFLAALIGVFTVILDVVYGFYGWSVAYVLPGIILAIALTVIILMIVNKRSRQSYIMIQLFMAVVSSINLVTDLLLEMNSLLALMAFSIWIFLFLGTVIIGGEKAREELRRRFHIF